MRYQGKLIEWNDAKGFGFVQPNAGGRKLFVHINSFRGLLSGRRPAVGDLISFAVGLDGQRRSCAVDAERVPTLQERQRLAQRHQARATRSLASTFILVLGLVWSVGVALLALRHPSREWIIGGWLAVNLVCFVMYGADKSAAQSDRRRTPEANLHLLALLGGWPAAALAQRVFNHKSSKAAFRSVFWVTILLNVVATLWYMR